MNLLCQNHEKQAVFLNLYATCSLENNFRLNTDGIFSAQVANIRNVFNVMRPTERRLYIFLIESKISPIYRFGVVYHISCFFITFRYPMVFCFRLKRYSTTCPKRLETLVSCILYYSHFFSGKVFKSLLYCYPIHYCRKLCYLGVICQKCNVSYFAKGDIMEDYENFDILRFQFSFQRNTTSYAR